VTFCGSTMLYHFIASLSNFEGNIMWKISLSIPFKIIALRKLLVRWWGFSVPWNLMFGFMNFGVIFLWDWSEPLIVVKIIVEHGRSLKQLLYSIYSWMGLISALFLFSSFLLSSFPPPLWGFSPCSFGAFLMRVWSAVAISSIFLSL